MSSSPVAGDISVATLQTQVSDHKKKAVGAAVLTVAALVGCIILGCFAYQDHVRLVNLQDEMRNWENNSWWDGHYNPDLGAQLQDKMNGVSSLCDLNLGFSITLLVISLLGLGATINQVKKMGEAKGMLKSRPTTSQAEEMEPTVVEKQKKKVLITAIVAAVSISVFIILASFALDCKFKVDSLWDKWHDWHDNNPWLHPMDGPNIQDQIQNVKTMGLQELGFGFAFLAVGLSTLAYAIYNYKKKAEVDAQAKPVAAPDL